MQLTVVAVGKLGRGPVADAVRDFEGRAARYWPLVQREVRHEPASALTPGAVRQREWARVGEALPSGSLLVLCDERGHAMTSVAFAAWVTGLHESGRDASFVIGGAFGFPDEARAQADTILTLAPWTVSHDLARLVLAEQLYRAGTIRRGEPYHKG